MPQFSYDHPVAFNGQIADSRQRDISSYLNALVAQETAILWNGNTNDAIYSVRIVGEEVDVTLDFDPGGVTTSDAIAIGITAAALANEDLINVVTVTDAVADTNEFVFLHEDRAYTVTAIIGAGGNGTGTVSEVVAPGGTRIGLGLVVVQGAVETNARIPQVGDTATNALGILVRNTDSEVNEGDPVVTDGFPPGSMLSVMQEGACFVFTEDTVVANAAVFFRITGAALPNELVGRVRSDVDGGQAVALFGARFVTGGAAGALVKVSINLPANA